MWNQNNDGTSNETELQNGNQDSKYQIEDEIPKKFKDNDKTKVAEIQKGKTDGDDSKKEETKETSEKTEFMFKTVEGIIQNVKVGNENDMNKRAINSDEYGPNISRFMKQEHIKMVHDKVNNFVCVTCPKSTGNTVI